MKKYLFMLLALCLMPANNTAQILNSLKDIIRPTDPSLIRTLNGQWDFYFINGADWKEQACFCLLYTSCVLLLVSYHLKNRKYV